jgi:hypothetical protein
MNRSRRLALAALLPLTLVVPASAAAAGFGPPQPLDLPAARPLAAAIGPGGAAIVAGTLGGAPAQARVEVAVRAAAGAPWRTAGFGTSAALVRDVQVAIGRRATVVAWSEVRRHSQAVVVATADSGGGLTVRERVPVTSATSAFPRLAVLSSDVIELAWRDGRRGKGSRVRVAAIDGDHFAGAPRTAGTNATQIILAARGAGASVGWTSPLHSIRRAGRSGTPRALPRTLTVRSLDGHGRPTGTAAKVGSDVGATARLAGAPDGRLVASWLRPQKVLPFAGDLQGDPPPPSAIVAPLAFTRQVLPRTLPARPLGSAGAIPAGVPSIALDATGQAVAAMRVSPPNVGPAFDAVAAGSTGGGPWSGTRLVAHLGFSNFDPVAVATPSDGAVIVSTALVAAPGTPLWTVEAADATGVHAVGTTNGGDGRGLAVARAGSRVLIAWPTAAGVQVSERG